MRLSSLRQGRQTAGELPAVLQLTVSRLTCDVRAQLRTAFGETTPALSPSV
jgi:hypothetical protein